MVPAVLDSFVQLPGSKMFTQLSICTVMDELVC